MKKNYNHDTFRYYWSNLFYQEYAEHKASGNITFEDGTRYLFREVDIMKKNDFTKDEKKTAHTLKQLFNGTLEEGVYNG